jgi:hypothetical protein
MLRYRLPDDSGMSVPEAVANGWWIAHTHHQIVGGRLAEVLDEKPF